MVNTSDYINSGILEQHCFDIFDEKRGQEIMALRLVRPQIDRELNEIEDTIFQIAKSQAIQPSPRLKQSILAALGFTGEEKLDIVNLPLTGKSSSHTAWLNTIAHLLPAKPYEDFFASLLRQDIHIAQTLVVTRMDVPEEIHEEVAESFFILHGQCACTVGHETFILNAGDHLEIPLHINHDIKILSPYVIAILQHQFA
jgi:mannose-6-phosphate isomerase-like protein (cupin superfamily)